MKKSKILGLFFTLVLLGGCMSSDQKKEDARNQTQTALDNLNDAKNNEKKIVQKAATEDELKTFKLESKL